MPQARISKILTWSCVDGPGNRLVLFMQDCNFACGAGHNSHTIGQCNDCGDCIAVCPTGALQLMAGRMQFDPTLCTLCDAGLDGCPISASPMALPYSVADIVALLHQNRPFLNAFQHHGVRGPTRSWPTMPRARVQAAADRLQDAGIEMVVMPLIWL